MKRQKPLAVLPRSAYGCTIFIKHLLKYFNEDKQILGTKSLGSESVFFLTNLSVILSFYIY